MSCPNIRSIAFAALSLVNLPAAAEPVTAWIETRDVLALEAFHGSPEETRLAHGAALALRHKDDAAIAVLKDIAQSRGALRAGACLALSDVYLRQSRFAETRAALECVQEASGKPLTGETAQVFAWADALSGERPMQLAQPAAGKLNAWRDSAGLIRVTVTINDKAQDVVIDTDASLSVISESTARTLNVRVLEKGVTILTSTRPDLPIHLGVADKLKFGEAVFRDVVFAVLPDSAVRFSQNYKMNAVIGLPVLVALERTEYDKEDGSLYYGAKPSAVAAEPNVALSGLDPFVLAKAGNAFLRLAIDTAATNTTLNATALKDFPALGENTARGSVRWEGGGGARTDTRARTLYDWNLVVADRSITLRSVNILSTAEPDRHGMIGQDLLKQGKGWVLDFAAVRFTIRD